MFIFYLYSKNYIIVIPHFYLHNSPERFRVRRRKCSWNCFWIYRKKKQKSAALCHTARLFCCGPAITAKSLREEEEKPIHEDCKHLKCNGTVERAREMHTWPPGSGRLCVTRVDSCRRWRRRRTQYLLVSLYEREREIWKHPWNDLNLLVPAKPQGPVVCDVLGTLV